MTTVRFTFLFIDVNLYYLKIHILKHQYPLCYFWRHALYVCDYFYMRLKRWDLLAVGVVVYS